MLRRAAYSPNIKERADCSAALFTADGELLVQAEHIPVHLGSMPASVRGRHRRVSATARAGRPGRAQRPVRRRHAPERRHARRAVLRRRRARRLGRRTAPTTPTSAAWRRARCRPRRPRSSRRACASRRSGSTTACEEIVVAQLAHARRASAATSTRSGARTGSASRARAIVERSARRPRSPRSSTTASGACAPRWRRSPTAQWRFDDVLDSAGPRPSSSRRRRIALTLTVDGDERDVRLHRDRRAATRQRQRGRGGDRRARSRSRCASATDPTIPANGGAMRPVRVIAPRGHRRRGACRRSRSAPATSR